MRKFYKKGNKIIEETDDGYFGKGILHKHSANYTGYCIGDTSIYYGRPNGIVEISENEFNEKCVSMLKKKMKEEIDYKLKEIEDIRSKFAVQIKKY